MASELNLDAIEARANAATEGPWTLEVSGWSGKRVDTLSSPSSTVIMGQDERGGASWSDDDDAEFIAHAREDVPALVKHVRELEAVVERVRAIEVADRVDHSQHVGAGGGPCGVPVSWKSRMGRDLARALEGATE
jgi:hypothetical protein